MCFNKVRFVYWLCCLLVKLFTCYLCCLLVKPWEVNWGSYPTAALFIHIDGGGDTGDAYVIAQSLKKSLKRWIRRSLERIEISTFRAKR